MKDSYYTKMELRLRADCERGFNVGPKTPSQVETEDLSKAPTGEPFIQLAPLALPCASDQETADVALATFRDYAKKQGPGTLYWRTYPEIERGKFYMRLLISDKPLLPSLKK